MNILAPWSLSTYLPLNGFHPLYRSLAGIRARDVQIVTPKKPGADQFRSMIECGIFEHKIDLTPPDWANGADSKLMFRKFVDEHGTEDIWLQSNLPGDVELHHTAPATRGDRPFLFHCESFLPVFYPFFEQGVELDRAQVGKIRALYRNLFESRNCLGIVSHVPETLDQLSHFFESRAIDDRLIGMPIGLDPAYIANGVEKSTETTNFVFLNSAHQKLSSFAKRGGVSCLKLATQLLRERSDLKFYFRTERPEDVVLADYGIDVKELKRHEVDRIIWIEQYLPRQSLNTLIARCHFMLLPSANLHSVSIMSAMANGTIPIVTDTVGTDVYVDDMMNGVVMRGVRSEIWEKDEALRLTSDRHTRFLGMEKTVTASLIAKVRELLSMPEKIADMARAGRITVHQRFDGATFANRLIEEARSRCARTAGNGPHSRWSRYADGMRWMEEISHLHFEGPPTPCERVKLHNGSIYQLGGNFIFIPLGRSHKFINNRICWSPLRLALEEFSPRLPKNSRVACASSLGNCIQLARAQEAPGGILPAITELLWSQFNLKERVWLLLRPYRTPFVIVRKTYRFLRRLGIVS